MKGRIIKVGMLMVLFGFIVEDASAQRRARRRTETTTEQQQQQQENNNTTAPTYNAYGNIPIRVDSSGGGYNDSVVKKSLRPDAAFDKDFVTDRTPLPYEHLRWDDALYAQKVWRELDLREKLNQTFRYKAEDDNGDQRFISMLLKAVKSGQVVAFADDRFTTPLSSEENAAITAGGPKDTVAVRDIDDPNKIVEYVVTQPSFDPETVLKLRI